MEKKYHVSPRGRQWEIKLEGNEKATRVFLTQKAGIEWIKENINDDVSIFIHRQDGSVRTVERSMKKADISNSVEEKKEVKQVNNTSQKKPASVATKKSVKTATKKTPTRKKQPKDITVAIPVAVDEQIELSAKELMKKKKAQEKERAKKEKMEAKQNKIMQKKIKKMKKQ